jgi:hypothetical protein
MKRRAGLRVALMVLFCVSGVVVAPAAAAQPGVAFRGSFTGTVSDSFPDYHFTGAGTASVIGASTMDSLVTQTGIFRCGADAFVFTGEVHFTARNGDQLDADIAFRFCIVSYDPAGHGALSAGSITFTGGTGRFSNASGGATFSGSLDFNAGGAFTETYTGTIRLH